MGLSSAYEEAAAARVDLLRVWELLDRSFPEPIVHAALGLISGEEARRTLRMRKSTVLALVRQARLVLPRGLTRL